MRVEPLPSETRDFGLKLLVPFLFLPSVKAGNLSLTLFFLIMFASNILLPPTTISTLGITVTLGTFGFMALVVFLLFIF